MSNPLLTKRCPSCDNKLDWSVLRGFFFTDAQQCKRCNADMLLRKDVAALINLGSYTGAVFLGIALAPQGGAFAFFMTCFLGVLIYSSLTVVGLLCFNLQLRAPVDDAAQSYTLAIALLLIVALAAVVLALVLRDGA